MLVLEMSKQCTVMAKRYSTSRQQRRSWGPSCRYGFRQEGCTAEIGYLSCRTRSSSGSWKERIDASDGIAHKSRMVPKQSERKAIQPMHCCPSAAARVHRQQKWDWPPACAWANVCLCSHAVAGASVDFNLLLLHKAIPTHSIQGPPSRQLQLLVNPLVPKRACRNFYLGTLHLNSSGPPLCKY